MDEKAIDGWFQFDYVLDLAKGTETQYTVIGWLADSLHQNGLQGLAEKNQWKATGTCKPLETLAGLVIPKP